MDTTTPKRYGDAPTTLTVILRNDGPVMLGARASGYSPRLVCAACDAIISAAAKLDIDPLTLAERLGEGEIAVVLNGLKRTGEFKEQAEGGTIWDDACRNSLDLARRILNGKGIDE